MNDTIAISSIFKKTSLFQQKMFGMRAKRSTVVFIIACLLRSNSMTAQNISIITDYIDLSSCSLNCANNGICQFLDGTLEELQKQMQSGLMIMKCQCTVGYTGMGCEQARPICNLQTLKCPNGIPCEAFLNSSPTQYHCDCSVADRISTTTARFCRNTYTEYCSSSISHGSNISFCTNGGKCMADIISAEVAPFNTSVNAHYEHAGCICPSEYDGPHCEFLRGPTIISPPEIPNNNTSTQAPTMHESFSSSETMEPTTIESDETSLEDMINAYNNQTKSSRSNEASTNNDGRQILRIVLSSLFVSIAIIGLGMAAMTYHHRRIKKRRLILLQKSFIPTNSTNNRSTSFYQSPSITGSVSSASEVSLSSASSMNRTIKTGTRTNYTDEPLPTSQLPPRYHNTRKKKKRKTNRNLIPEPTCTLAAIDDCDIVSVSNERSFHRRCYPLTPFVVDDDVDDADVDDDNDNDGTQELETQRRGGLWNDSDDNRSPQIQPISTVSLMPTTPYRAQQSTDHIQSWIVSLSNRAINFTEVVRPPGYNSRNHQTMIEPVLDELHNTCNDIYLVDDDDDDDDDQNNNDIDDDNNKFVDHL